MGDGDGGDQHTLDQVAADDQPASIAPIGDRAGDQSEREVRNDTDRVEQPCLRCRSGDLVHDQRQDHTGDGTAQHRDALCCRPPHEPRLGA